MPTSRPQILVSYTQTLDGRLATATGNSMYIGSGASLQFVHQLRATHAAIMVGVQTVIQDNPRLTVRLVSGPDPLRVIVDSRLRTPLSANVLTQDAANTLIATTDQADPARRSAVEQCGAQVLLLPADAAGRVDLRALLAHLAACTIDAIMVEGGATLITALLQARLVDRMVVGIAPKIMGKGIAAVGELGIRDLDRMIELADVTVHQAGVDLLLDGRVVYPEHNG